MPSANNPTCCHSLRQQIQTTILFEKSTFPYKTLSLSLSPSLLRNENLIFHQSSSSLMSKPKHVRQTQVNKQNKINEKDRKRALQLKNHPHLFFHSSTSFIKCKYIQNQAKKRENIRFPFYQKRLLSFISNKNQEHVTMETEHQLNLLCQCVVGSAQLSMTPSDAESHLSILYNTSLFPSFQIR